MSNKFLEIVKTYQKNDYVHELTCICGAGALDPIEKDGKVILQCKTCGWIQEIDDFLAVIIYQMYNYDPFGTVKVKNEKEN